MASTSAPRAVLISRASGRMCAERGRIHQAAGLVRQRAVQADHVGAREQLPERRRAVRRRPSAGSRSPDGSRYGRCAASTCMPNARATRATPRPRLPSPTMPSVLPGESRETGNRAGRTSRLRCPGAGAQQRFVFPQPMRQRQDQREHVLGHRRRAVVADVRYGDAAGAGGVECDVVGAGGGEADELQPRRDGDDALSRATILLTMTISASRTRPANSSSLAVPGVEREIRAAGA